MNRHVNELTAKARKHTVYADSQGKNFVVESGTSGNLYRVRQHAAGAWYYCECTWAENNDASECSHITAVRMRGDVPAAKSMPSISVMPDGTIVIR